MEQVTSTSRPFQHERVLILGSSLVRNLAAAMSDEENQNIRLNFGFDNCFIQTYGVGGRRARELYTELWAVTAFSPEIVIIHAGGNDLARMDRDGQCEVVADSLVQYAELLHTQYGVKYVIVTREV